MGAADNFENDNDDNDDDDNDDNDREGLTKSSVPQMIQKMILTNEAKK